jgi:hypothetical protein
MGEFGYGDAGRLNFYGRFNAVVTSKTRVKIQPPASRLALSLHILLFGEVCHAC